MTRVSLINREHLIRAYEEGRDFIKLASDIGVSRRSAYRIVRIFSDEGRRRPLPHAGGRNKVLLPEMIAYLISTIEEKPTITLLEMKQKLLSVYPGLPASLSPTTISRALDGALITLKLLRNVPMQWNSDEVKAERRDYVTW